MDENAGQIADASVGEESTMNVTPDGAYDVGRDVALEAAQDVTDDALDDTEQAAAQDLEQDTTMGSTAGSARTPSARVLTRRRRANVSGGRGVVRKVKVTPEEEGVLMRLALAQGVTVPRLLVESALATDVTVTSAGMSGARGVGSGAASDATTQAAPQTATRVVETATQRRDAMTELFALHRLLGSISNNANQVARAANASGRVDADLVAEMAATLRAVRRTAERIDDAIDALSLGPGAVRAAVRGAARGAVSS